MKSVPSRWPCRPRRGDQQAEVHRLGVVRQQAEQPRGVGDRHEGDDQETVADKNEIDGVGLLEESAGPDASPISPGAWTYRFLRRRPSRSFPATLWD